VLEPDPELAVEYGLFSVSQARAAGHDRADIKKRLRSEEWLSLGRAVLQVTGRSSRPDDGLVLAQLRAGPAAVVGFEHAARLLGWDLPRAPREPRLLVPLACKNGLGYRVQLSDDEVILRGVLRLTTPRRTALDIASTSDFGTSVIILDSALRSGQTTLEDLRRTFARAGRSGVRAARIALESVDPLSGSVPESRARLLFAEAGLPAPVSQFVLRDGLRFVARLDFAWERALLAVEIDGFAYHSAGGDFQADRSRQNAVQLQGWLVLRFTVADLRDDPGRVIGEIREALLRRSTYF
jgi:hypothetical protein